MSGFNDRCHKDRLKSSNNIEFMFVTEPIKRRANGRLSSSSQQLSQLD